MRALAPAPPLPVLNTDNQDVVDAAAVLNTLPEGRAVLEQLSRDRTLLIVQPDDVYRKQEPLSGANYHQNRITFSQRTVSNAWVGATILAHEGQHRIDDARESLLGRMGGAIAAVAGATLLAPLRLQNPITAGTDAMLDTRLETELNAYELQTRIAHQLRLRNGGSHGERPDGTARTRDEILQRLKRTELYGLHGTERLVHSIPAAGVLAVAVLGVTSLVPPLNRFLERTPAAIALLPLGLATLSLWDAAANPLPGREIRGVVDGKL